jgi:hypothetical protein
MDPPTDGTANLQPTAAYGHFQHAETLHKTVRELLGGQPAGPLTGMEQYLWVRYQTAKSRLVQQAERGRTKRH